VIVVEGHYDIKHEEKEGEQEEGFPGTAEQERRFKGHAANKTQKPKLKVGKARPKAANSTNTSFRAKCELPGFQILAHPANILQRLH
jgi:hypothetical protein